MYAVILNTLYTALYRDLNKSHLDLDKSYVKIRPYNHNMWIKPVKWHFSVFILPFWRSTRQESLESQPMSYVLTLVPPFSFELWGLREGDVRMEERGVPFPSSIMGRDTQDTRGKEKEKEKGRDAQVNEGEHEVSLTSLHLHTQHTILLLTYPFLFLPWFWFVVIHNIP